METHIINVAARGRLLIPRTKLYLVSLHKIAHGDGILATEEAEDDTLDSMIELESERAHAKKLCYSAVKVTTPRISSRL